MLTERLALLIDARADGAVRDIKSLAKEAARTDDQAAKLEKRGQAIGTAWKVGVGVAAGAALIKLGQLSGKAIDDASSLAETVNKVGVVFGAEAQRVLKFGENAASSIGQSKQQALAAAATFGQFFDAAGLAGDAAADMSMDVVKLASDLASFNDADPSEVIDNLRSGLSGESEPLRKFGVFLNEAAVAAKAAELGLQGVNGKLTDGEKVQARYALILDQTTKAQGDFARTSDGVANKERTKTALMENASAALGEGLLPAQLAYTNALVDAAPAITAVAQGVGGLVKSFSGLPGPVQAVVGATTILSAGYLVLAPRINDTRQALKDLSVESPRAAKGLSLIGKAAGVATVVIALDAALKGLNSTLDESVPKGEKLKTQILDIADGRVKKLSGEFDDFAQNLENIGTGGLFKVFDGADSIPAVSDAVATLNNVLPGEAEQEKFRKFKDQLAAIDEQMASLVASGGPQEAKEAFEALADSLNLSATGRRELMAGLPGFEDALAGAANQTRVLGNVTEDTGEKTDDAADKQGKMREALRAARQEAKGTAREFLGLGDSLDDNEVSLKGWLREMEKSTQALAHFRENAIKAARRGLNEGLIASLQEAGPEGALRMRQLANATDAELARANAAWRGSRAEMERWVNFKVPPKTVEVDTSRARGELREVKYALDGIQSKTVTITVKRLGNPTANSPVIPDADPRRPSGRTSGRMVLSGAGLMSGGVTPRGFGSMYVEAERQVETFARSTRKASTITEKHAAQLLKSAEKIRDGIDDRVRNLMQQRASAASGFASAFGSSVFGSGETTIEGVLGMASTQAQDSVNIKTAIAALIQKGVSEDVLKQLAAGGKSGWDQIKALAGADATQIAEFNKLTQISSSNLLAAGNLLGGALFNDDIRAAKNAEKQADRIVGMLEKALDKRDKNTTVELRIGAHVIRTTLLELKRKTGQPLGFD